MKIGLLTYHAACNFGANLQALSTLSYWRNQGYEPVFINWMTEELENSYRKKTPSIQFEEHEKFRKQYFPMTQRCYTDEDVAKVVCDEGIEAIVVGSDAVMQTRPNRSRYVFPTRHIISKTCPQKDITCPNPFWGSYYHLLDKKIPLCYMSASCQNSPYRSSNRHEKQLQKDLLLQYNYISTRDDWTSQMVSWLTDGEVVPDVTPDPVFAFNYNVKNQPDENDIRQRFGLADHYCLFCFHNDKTVSQQWLKDMEEKLSKRGVQCVAFPFPQGIEFHHPFNKQISLPLSPLDWYAIIKYADFYVGDNMHPIVICLHNAVPCFSFDHYGIVRFKYFVNERSSKVYHIMNQFGHLSNRISIKGRYREPSTDYVLERLYQFNKKQVSQCAERYLDEYKKMMLQIETIINQ